MLASHHSSILHVLNQLNVTVPEGVSVVFDSMLLGERLDVLLHNVTEIVARNTGEKMVLCLELESTVEPIHPPRAVNVHSSVKLNLEPMLLITSLESSAVVGVHGKVRKANLDVEDSTDGVGDKEEDEPVAGLGDHAKDGSKPDGVDEHGTKLIETSTDLDTGVKTEDERLDVKVNTGNSHDRVEEVVLVAGENLRGGVELLLKLVVTGVVSLEDLVGDGENGKMLNIGVMLNRVGHHMMRVVVSLPPLSTDAKEGRDENSKVPVAVADVCDRVVAKIVTQKGKLLPEDTKNSSRNNIKEGGLVVNGRQEDCEEDGEDDNLPKELESVPHVVGVIDSLGLHLLIDFEEVLADLLLLVVLDHSDLVVGKLLGQDLLRVEPVERLSHIATSEINDGKRTTRVVLDKAAKKVKREERKQG